jgi:hypothetical protein
MESHTGHRQLTNIYLLALTPLNEGRLATFDASISERAIGGAKERNLELIAAWIRDIHVHWLTATSHAITSVLDSVVDGACAGARTGAAMALLIT